MRRSYVKRLVAGTSLEPIARRIHSAIERGSGRASAWTSSPNYWEERYQKGGTSGAGSYGHLAAFKAEILNDFVATHDVSTVIEFGCGDGNQLKLARYPQYLGVDVSRTAVSNCRKAFEGDTTKVFIEASEYADQTADLVLSLDVIFHLVEDDVFDAYMSMLFDAATRFVIIYSSNHEEQPADSHVRHRKFTDWIARHRPSASMMKRIPNRFPFAPNDPDNTSFADFYIYKV